MKIRNLKTVSMTAVIAASLFSVGTSHAQVAGETSDGDTQQGASDRGFNFLDDVIVVTGTKKADGENVQDAALAITAYGADTLDALQVRDISGLSFKMPNVALDEIGTTKGVANFTIRGLGVNSSIPSIEPAVGVFVDGVYLGINGGVVFDTFDLAGVETLRGPQGILFGRNVTGGAVLLNTSDPENEFRVNGKLIAESGLRGTGGNYYAMGTVTGPLVKDVLSAKLAVYYNKDDGWFENSLITGGTETFGRSDTFIIRGGLKLTPDERGDMTIKFEHGESDGQGTPTQNHRNGSGVDGQIVNFDRETHDFSIDDRGFYDSEWNQLTATVNIDVAFGDGTVTNIFGWRDYSQTARVDIDATPVALLHAGAESRQNQISNELRYFGRFGDIIDLTAGLYYFSQEISYYEGRDILGGALTQDGGGVQDQETFGVFAQFDFDLTDKLSLNAGVRYSDETKNVKIASLSRNVNSPCNFIQGTCPIDFNSDFSTSNWSPKIGLGYEISDNARAYAHWARAYRAGGYNFRNTSVDTVNFGPGPFQDERIDSFEVGVKSEPMSRSRLNFSIFYNQLSDMQREINLADPVAGIVQVIRNTADATIWGVELDGQAEIMPGVLLEGSIGYVDGDYRNVTFDLNGDGVLNSADADLDIPRLANLSANAGIIIEQETEIGLFTARASYSHRDRAAYTDNNLGFLNAADIVDASLSLGLLDGDMIFTIFGRNLTNDVQFGADSQLPNMLGPVPLGGTSATLSKGRTFGIELKFKKF